MYYGFAVIFRNASEGVYVIRITNYTVRLVCPINIRIKKLTKTHAYLYTCFRPTKGGKLLYTDVQSAV